MIDFKSKFKRQIEILGICIGKNYQSMTIGEIAGIFGVEELTIKRDMNDLRSSGIAIHSLKGKGVEI